MRNRRSPALAGCLLLLSATLALSACGGRPAVSQAVSADATVARPALDESDLDTWRAYYASQFSVYGENALEPADYYPESSREAYLLERRAWEQERLAAVERQRRRENIYARIAFVAIGLAAYGAYALVTRD